MLSTTGVFLVRRANVFTALRRLEEKGFVSSRMG
jgi:DNA-binding MarR family transcriptional regulator